MPITKIKGSMNIQQNKSLPKSMNTSSHAVSHNASDIAFGMKSNLRAVPNLRTFWENSARIWRESVETWQQRILKAGSERERILMGRLANLERNNIKAAESALEGFPKITTDATSILSLSA